MANLYFRLEQRAAGGSPTTGSTIIMVWDDTQQPNGLSQSATVSYNNTNPNATWSFRSRTWKLTNLGSTPISSDTQMLAGEPWSVNAASFTTYIGRTFDINTTFFARNYITVEGPNGQIKSPRFVTPFYSASSFNATSKVIGTDTNRYDTITLTGQTDYTHITNFSVPTYDFNSSTTVVSDLIHVGVNTYYNIIPYSATAARNYFNSIYDGWISMSDDCYGNLFTGVNGIIYGGDMHDRSESYSSKFGGPCLRPNNTQAPYSGNKSTDPNLTGRFDILVNWYSDCVDCQTNNTFNNIYKFETTNDCLGSSSGAGQVFSGSSLTWGQPQGGGVVGPQVISLKLQCFGGEGTNNQVEISTALGGNPVSAIYDNCSDCGSQRNPIDEYYYFSACTASKIYKVNSIDFDNDFTPDPSIGSTYLFTNVGDITNGCYTAISSFFGMTTIDIDYWDNNISTYVITSSNNCSDAVCSSPTPTPTPTPPTTPAVTQTVTPTDTPSVTSTPTDTPSVTLTPTPTSTPGGTPSVTQTVTPTDTPPVTPTPSSLGLSDKLNSCEVTSESQKVFVFYDGTSLDESSAQTASESIRTWYNTKVSNGDLTANQLYEGVIGETSNNGENWMWWASYPHLGSLSGGTVNGVQINEFNSPVTNSIYNSGWCSSNVGTECVPKPAQFNDETQASSIYRRINRGYALTGSYGINDGRSNGVPFDHNNLDLSSTSGPGTFSGQESNYIVVFVEDEADGLVGMYTGSFLKANDIFTKPFELQGSSWANQTDKEYTNRFQYDYESYLKVWNNIRVNNGSVNGLVYPVVTSNTSQTPAFVLHSVAASQGDTISSSDFLTAYGENIVSVGPYTLNLSALTRTNRYSGLTTTTAYQNLPVSEQNGSGLKNFGILTDPTVVNFTESVVASSLDSFLTNIQTPLSVIYVSTGGRNRNEVYNISGDCYTVDAVSITPPESLTNATNQIGPFTTCIDCNTTGCFSGTTDGNFTFTDCCGVVQQGNQIGLVVCIDTSVTYQGIAISTNQCVQSCDEGPLSYDFTVTGTCTNPKGGTIIISPSGGTKPYTITNTITTNASSILLSPQTGNGPFGYSGVDEGNYVFILNDSSGGVNQDVTINVNVEGCFTATTSNVSGTTCGNFNSGQITVSNNSLSSPYQYDLYNNASGTIVQTFNNILANQTFTGLIPGTYYSIVTDFGGATAQTNNAVIVNTTPITYNVLVVDDSPCGQSVGSATVTDLTGGTSPYSYLWSNGQTSVTATNLTQGSFGVAVTDSDGCVVSQTFIVGLADPLGFVSSIPTPADCFTCDGQLAITISGGSAPYTYQNSDGAVFTTNNLSQSFTGLCGGFNNTIVTDAGGCNITSYDTITSTAGFNVVSIISTNSDCNDDGSISIAITAPQGIYTYSVTNSLGTTQSLSTSIQNHTFFNLPSDTYTVTIAAQNGTCTYTTQETITNSPSFIVGTTITSGTCGNNNGVIDIILTAGSTALQLPFDYKLTDINTSAVVYSVIDVTVTTLQIPNLVPSTYLLEVTDRLNCTVSKTITISPSIGMDFGLTSTDCITGNDGTATINIFEGLAPFVIQWDNGETTMSISGLSGGTYSVTVIDANGCIDTETVGVKCDNQNVVCYELNEICKDGFITTTAGVRDFEFMLNEGFNDLTSGHTDCTLNSAVFYAIVDFSGGTLTPALHVENPFYTGTTLSDYPSMLQWMDAVNTILLTVPQIASFTLNISDNLITLISDCEELNNVFFRLSTKIIYDITCIDIPTPTPTPTTTLTPTPTPTQAVVVIDDETEINIVFDNSGSMNSTLAPLQTMATTILKTCLLPFYNNDSTLYDNRVNVVTFTAAPGVGTERGYAALALSGTTSSITKVINLVFQDEAASIYTSSSSSWSNLTSRTSAFNTDIALMRGMIDNNTSNYILGEYFQVSSTLQRAINFKALLEAVEDGLGQYTGVNGLSDKTEIHNTYDVINGSTPQYYMDLIITAINNLGYNVPVCGPQPTATPTPTPTPADSILTVNTDSILCSSGSATIVNGSGTIFNYSRNSSDVTYSNVDTFNVQIGDTLTIYGNVDPPVGSGCVSSYTKSNLSVLVDGTQQINVSNTNGSYQFTVSSSTVNISFDFTVSA